MPTFQAVDPAILVNLTNISKTWGYESAQFTQALSTAGISHEVATGLIEAAKQANTMSKVDDVLSLQYQIQNLAIRPKPM